MENKQQYIDGKGKHTIYIFPWKLSTSQGRTFLSLKCDCLFQMLYTAVE